MYKRQVTDAAIGKISYQVTGDADVKILICEAGTQFKVLSATESYVIGSSTYTFEAGDILPKATGKVVRYLNYQCEAGSHVKYWNGTYEDGVIVSTGITW